MRPTTLLTRIPLGPALLLVAVTAVWGWTFTVVQQATRQYGVLPFLALRFSLAALVMLPAVVRRAHRGTYRAGWVVGLVLAAAYLFQTYGLQHTSATNCGLITGLFAVFAPLLNRLLFQVPTRPFLWVATALSLWGLVLLTGTDLESLRLGDVLTFAAAALLGLHIALLDRTARHHDAAALTGVQFLATAAVFVVLSTALHPWRLPGGPVAVAIVITALAATAGGFYAQTLVQQRLSAVKVALILMLEPVFAALFGVWLAGDRLTAWQWLGGAIVLLAMLLSERD